MNEVLKEFLMSVVTLLSLVLSSCITKLFTIKIAAISNKAKNEKRSAFLNWINEIIVQCVDTTTQTYVDNLKKTGSFTVEAQEEALKQTLTHINNLLSETDTETLNKYVGDASTWITTSIQSYIQESKKA